MERKKKRDSAATAAPFCTGATRRLAKVAEVVDEGEGSLGGRPAGCATSLGPGARRRRPETSPPGDGKECPAVEVYAWKSYFTCDQQVKV